ncbi:MAG TPA: nucleotidyltransferase family protein, partial [Longimicrobium sp.]|nr:nucleotidyltransferase family protein [Longimicrobium sp.]
MRETAAEALALRGWALRALSAGADDPPPAAPDAAWTVFLATEGCGIALVERMRQTGTPPPAVLERWARAELVRVLSARSQLRLLDRAAGRGGWAAVVLKGGASVADDPALDLVDLDLLLRREDVLAYAAALEADGYASLGADYVEEGSQAHHLGIRALPGSIPVELHFQLPVPGGAEGPWERRIPLAGTRHLSRLAAEDHLWHLLYHAAVQHTYKRGRVRDLLLIARVMGECGEAGRAAVRARAAADRGAAVLLATWRMAESLAAGTAPADAFRRIAAGNYVLRAAPPGGKVRAADVVVCLFAVLGEGGD